MEAVRLEIIQKDLCSGLIASQPPGLFRVFVVTNCRKSSQNTNYLTMDFKTLSLKILPGRMAVCRFDPLASLPDWIDNTAFYSVTRTNEELTVVCRENSVATGTTCESGWRCIRVQGVLDFSEIGIIFTIIQPLAKTGVSVFVISTYDTDYFLVKEKELPKAVDVLKASGHQITESKPESSNQMPENGGQ